MTARVIVAITTPIRPDERQQFMAHLPLGNTDTMPEPQMSSNRARRFKTYALLSLPLLLMLLFLWIVGNALLQSHTLQRGPNGQGFDSDLAMFLGAATVLHSE